MCYRFGESMLKLRNFEQGTLIMGQKTKTHTFASLSFARCAYILGCSETFDILVARGNECSEEDTLGKATRPFLLDASRDVMERKGAGKVVKRG
jgi:hypothetical protein